jgi:HSP20 family molecular chaperone IbpA
MSLLNTLIPSLTRQPATAGAATNTLGQTVKPVFEIKENANAFDVTVYLPGVAKDGLEITAEDGQLQIVGRRAWKQPEGWTPIYRESNTAPFELVLTHDNTIDAEKVSAELRDGVLRVTLPKQEALKPRKIAVN